MDSNNVLSTKKNGECCAGLYLENVTLRKVEGAGGDVDALPSLNLYTVHTFVAVVVVHRIVGG